MRRILVVSLFLLIMSAAFSHSAVYKWTDEKGVVHYTDDSSQIPQKHRASIEKQEAMYSEPDAKKEAAPASKPKEEEAVTDRFGRGEEYWRGRVREWEGRVKTSQERIEVLRSKYNELTDKFNDSKSSAERSTLRKERDQIKKEMDDERERVNEAKVMLEKKLPEEAELFRAKPEWVKP
jgi:hypothetical protein